LSERKIWLRDPRSWDDSNDSYYLSVYRQKKKLETVLAICFTQTGETYHHWKVFAGSTSGVCVRFERTELLKAIEKERGTSTGCVEYLTVNQRRDQGEPKVKELPFLKRRGYQHEEEFRIIYESKTSKATLDIKIPLSCVRGITLSPWIPYVQYKHVKEMLCAIEGCSKLDIKRSTLTGNKEWKSFADRAK
jgi:Protein of unknown function (DUF2971)